MIPIDITNCATTLSLCCHYGSTTFPLVRDYYSIVINLITKKIHIYFSILNNELIFQ